MLHQFIEDMKVLQSSQGVLVDLLNNERIVLRASLESFACDGLAVHEIFEHLSPSCEVFCRICMISRPEFHENIFKIGELRSRNDHELQIQQMKDNPSKSKQFGIRKNSVLNELKHFHTTTNYVFDVMHDLLEGVVPMELKLVLNFFC